MSATIIDAEADREALLADAELRRREAVAVIRALWDDRADEAVQVELVWTLDALRQAEAAIKDAQR